MTWLKHTDKRQLKTMKKDILAVAWERRRRESGRLEEGEEGRKSRTLVVTGEGGEGKDFSWYAGTGMGDARVGEWPRAEVRR